jgi:transposase
VVHRSPRLLGLDRSRWWLDGLRQAVAWMAELSPGGVHRLLRRLGVRYKRGRRYVHSPDPLYDSKMAAVQAAAAEALDHPENSAFLYEDEFTYYRRPTAARADAAVGADDPRADQGHGNNSKRRVLASLDIRTGRLISWQRSSTGRDVLIRYFREVESHYPEVETVTIALDNWPVHFHEDVVTALAGTKIKLLRLPTYAPWANPVEQVWRWLYATILHHHEFRDDWGRLKEEVTSWLGRWADGSLELLHYVGLSPG